MNDSFAKEFVQLSSLGVSALVKQSAIGISTLLRESAKVIEAAADVTDWPQFEVTAYPDSTVLTFDLKGLDPSEYEIHYNSQTIRLNIRPYCQDYLIPNVTRFFSCSGYSGDKRVKLAKFAKAHQHLRWSTCTVDELHSFFSDWIVGVQGDSDGQYPWQSRALAMLKPVYSGSILGRDAGVSTMSAASLRAHFNLDIYLAMIDSEFVDQEALMTYLNALPGFHLEDAKTNNLSQKCYEHHGHLAMQLHELLAIDPKSTVVRSERLPDRDVARNFMSKSIASAEAVKIENHLEITVRHPTKEFVRLKVQG
jgi:hypothetical protein